MTGFVLREGGKKTCETYVFCARPTCAPLGSCYTLKWFYDSVFGLTHGTLNGGRTGVLLDPKGCTGHREPTVGPPTEAVNGRPRMPTEAAAGCIRRRLRSRRPQPQPIRVTQPARDGGELPRPVDGHGDGTDEPACARGKSLSPAS